MIWATSIWKLGCSNRSKIHSVQKCYLCLRYVVSPMCPGRTEIRWSGRKDLNLRPPGPEPGALARLRYAPTEPARPLLRLERKHNISITPQHETRADSMQFLPGVSYAIVRLTHRINFWRNSQVAHEVRPKKHLEASCKNIMPHWAVCLASF